MKKYLFILLLLSIQNIHAQTPSWSWAKSLIDTNGISLGGYCADADGNTYITGFFSSTIDFGGIVLTNSNGGAWPWIQMYVAKYNSAGNIVWATAPEGNCYPSGKAICTDADGNVYVTGIYHSYYFPDMLIFGQDTLTTIVQGVDQIFLAKYDSSGNALWAKSAGGGLADASIGIGVDSRGNVSVAGNFNSSYFSLDTITLYNPNSTSQSCGFIAHYEPTGHCIWAKSISTSAYNYILVNGMCTGLNGDSYLTGYFTDTRLIFDSDTLTNPSGFTAYFLAGLDSNGTVKWLKGATSTAASYANDAGNSVAIGQSGNVYVTGRFTSPTLDFGSGVIINSGNWDGFIVGYDSTGTTLWAKDIGGAGSDEIGSGITCDRNGNIFITGYFYSNIISIDLIQLTNSSASGSTSEGYVAMFDNSGVAVWGKSLGGILNEDGYQVGTDFNGDVYVAGHFNSPFLSFDGHVLINTSASSNIFFAKLDHLTNEIVQPEHVISFDIFPNPSTTHRSVLVRYAFNHTNVQVLNLEGKLCYAGVVETGSIYRMSTDFPAGVYFIVLQDDSGRCVRKLLIGE